MGRLSAARSVTKANFDRFTELVRVMVPSGAVRRSVGSAGVFEVTNLAGEDGVPDDETAGLRVSWHHWRKLVVAAEFRSRDSAS